MTINYKVHYSKLLVKYSEFHSKFQVDKILSKYFSGHKKILTFERPMTESKNEKQTKKLKKQTMNKERTENRKKRDKIDSIY